MAAKSGSKPTTPTHRTIAAEAGVSPMTVSLALRNLPSITAETRARVQAVALRQGYVPDPSVSRLMHLLRQRREQRLKAVIACLYPKTDEPMRPYARLIYEGAKARATKLGFALEIINYDPASGACTLQRILVNRGVQAILLLPPPHPLNLEPLLNWEGFCVISTTLSVTSPQFHRVLPNQFRNMLSLCRHLAQAGFKRPGFVTLAEHDQRVEHHFAAAADWSNHQYRKPRDRVPVPTFVTPQWPPDSATLTAWYIKNEPDVLITDGIHDLARVRKSLPAAVRDTLPGYVTSLNADDCIGGIDEHQNEIGVAAVDQLAGLFEHGELGVPASPRYVLIDGRIVSAPGRVAGKI